MAYFCNENVKLRVGGRKAPKGGKEKLNELLVLDKSGYHHKFDAALCGGDWLNASTGKTEHFDTISKDLVKDLSKYVVDQENVGDPTLGTTSTGVDYITTWIAGDWEVPVQIFVYWDGKHYRGYIPTKGNCINLINKSAFGNDENEDNAYKLKEFNMQVNNEQLDIDFNACLEDFEARLEVNGIAKTKPQTSPTATPVNESKREYSVQLTTPDESLNLLKLGVSIMSADHLYHNPYSDIRREIIYIDDDIETKETMKEVGEFNEKSDFIPAWSSSRMIEIYLKNANTDVAKVDYIVSGSTKDDLKKSIYSNLVKQLSK